MIILLLSCQHWMEDNSGSRVRVGGVVECTLCEYRTVPVNQVIKLVRCRLTDQFVGNRLN